MSILTSIKNVLIHLSSNLTSFRCDLLGATQNSTDQTLFDVKERLLKISQLDFPHLTLEGNDTTPQGRKFHRFFGPRRLRIDFPHYSNHVVGPMNGRICQRLKGNLQKYTDSVICIRSSTIISTFVIFQANKLVLAGEADCICFDL